MRPVSEMRTSETLHDSRVQQNYFEINKFPMMMKESEECLKNFGQKIPQIASNRNTEDIGLYNYDGCSNAGEFIYVQWHSFGVAGLLMKSKIMGRA